MRQRALFLFAVLLMAGCASTDAPEGRTVDFYNNNAQSYYDGGNYQQALNQFEKALEIDDSSRIALLGRAWSLLFLAESRILRGRKEGGETVQLALEAFREISDVDFDENTFKVPLGLGKVHVLLGDLFDARVRVLETEARALPDGAKTTEIATARKRRGEEYAKATRYFHQVLEQEQNRGARDNLTALLQLARLAVIRGEYDDSLLFAERYLEQVRRSKAHWIEVRRRYPEEQKLAEVKLAGAVTKEVEVREFISNALYKLGRLEKAEAELKQVILLSPERADAYMNRGIIREDLGRKQEALYDYDSFLRRAARLRTPPTDPRVMEVTQRIIRLRKDLGMPPLVPENAGNGKDGGGDS